MYGYLLLALLCATKAQDNEMGEVVFVNVLFRHGDRTPIALYKTDPHQNKSYWPEGFGQLTRIGRRQQFELGQWLRNRYDSLLTDLYSPDILYVQSTDVDRTLMSAESNLAGMFPPRDDQLWNLDLLWQPIPVHTTPVEQDNVLAQQASCPKYEEEYMGVVYSSKKAKELNETYSDLLQYVTEKTGQNVSLMNVGYIRDTLYIESRSRLKLPEWTKTVYPEPLQELTTQVFMFETWTRKLARLKTGLLLGEMVKNMENKVRMKTTRNVHVYSAHDQNIINLLNSLGAFNNLLPPYASCLMMELRADSRRNHFVTLYYRNSTTDAPYLMKVAGCAAVCPLDQFIRLSEPLIPKNWHLECGHHDKHYHYFLITMLSGIAALSSVLVFLAVLYCYCRRNSSQVYVI